MNARKVALDVAEYFTGYWYFKNFLLGYKYASFQEDLRITGKKLGSSVGTAITVGEAFLISMHQSDWVGIIFGGEVVRAASKGVFYAVPEIVCRSYSSLEKLVSRNKPQV